MELDEALILMPSVGFEWIQFIETLNSLVEVETDSVQNLDGKVDSATMEFQHLQ